MLRRSDGLVVLEAGRAGQDWVLARQFCSYTFLDASSIPIARRKSYVLMAVQRWSPFPDSSFHIEWVGPRAMVWAWSKSQIQRSSDGELALVPRRVWPESLFRGAPCTNEAALVGVDEGMEGRVWRNQGMTACHWWDAVPSLEEWNALLRGAGLPAVIAVPMPQAFPLAAVPWTRQRAEALNELASRHRTMLQALAVGLAIALLAVPFAACLRLAAKTALLEQVIRAKTASVGSTLQAREAAERDRAAVDELLQLRPPKRQLQLMSSVVAATPGTGWKLLEWRMPDTGSLEVVMQMANPDPTALVRGWEGSGVFKDVSVDIGRVGLNEVVIKAAIVGRSPVTPEGKAR